MDRWGHARSGACVGGVQREARAAAAESAARISELSALLHDATARGETLQRDTIYRSGPARARDRRWFVRRSLLRMRAAAVAW